MIKYVRGCLSILCKYYAILWKGLEQLQIWYLRQSWNLSPGYREMMIAIISAFSWYPQNSLLPMYRTLLWPFRQKSWFFCTIFLFLVSVASGKQWHKCLFCYKVAPASLLSTGTFKDNTVTFGKHQIFSFTQLVRTTKANNVHFEWGNLDLLKLPSHTR